MAMLATAPYRGPPASPVGKKHKVPSGVRAKLRKKHALAEGVSQLGVKDAAVHAKRLLQSQVNPFVLSKVSPRTSPASGASGGGGGRSKEWAGPRWNNEFGNGNAIYNLLANAALMKPLGSKKRHDFVPDPNYKGDGQCPPQPDPMCCYINNVRDLNALRIASEEKSFHSRRSRGWPHKQEPDHASDQLDISAFTDIQTEQAEGMSPFERFVFELSTTVGLQLYMRPYVSLSTSFIVVRKKDHPGILRLVYWRNGKGGKPALVMEMREEEFFNELDMFSDHIRPDQVDLETRMLNRDAMECFFCMFLKDNVHFVPSKQKVVEFKPSSKKGVLNEFETWSDTDLAKVMNWHKDSQRRFNSSTPMRIDYTNPVVTDAEIQGWALNLKKQAGQSYFNYFYFKKDFGCKYVRPDNPPLPKMKKPTFMDYAIKERALVEEIRYRRYWEKLLVTGSNLYNIELLKQGLSNYQLFLSLKFLEINRPSDDLRYEKHLLEMRLAPFTSHYAFGKYAMLEYDLRDSAEDISFRLFHEYRSRLFKEHVERVETSLSGRLRKRMHGVKKWLSQPLTTPAKDVATAESKAAQRSLKARLFKKWKNLPIDSAVKELSSILATETRELRDQPPWFLDNEEVEKFGEDVSEQMFKQRLRKLQQLVNV